jgi:hypothetical protein
LDAFFLFSGLGAPLASPTGPESLSLSISSGLGLRNVWIGLITGRLDYTKLTYELLKTLVAFLLEVQVVEDCLFALGLREGSEDDRHVEFTPSLLLDSEGSLLYACIIYAHQHVYLSITGKFEGQVGLEKAYFGWRACRKTRADGM